MKRALIALALLAGFTTASRAAEGRYEITYVNNANSKIVSIYAVNRETGQSRGDILPGVIEPGDSKTITFADGSNSCIYRTKVVTRNAETKWIDRDVCRVGQVTINGD